MSVLSLDKFVSLVERSKLVESHQLADAIVAWKRRASLRELDDARFCAQHLVESGLITQWQSEKLLEGRHRGFFLGKYKLLDHLGSGGMSSVYLAEHTLMRRQVAIKVLPHNRVGDSAYLARFHFEAQAAAALDHRNIVRAYDLDNEGKIHYLVMEYVEGRDLDAIVSQDGPLDYAMAASIICQAAHGLDHAHHCGLVHRDIKPANLLVDVKGTVKILDMGLAKFTSESRAPADLAPEEHILGTADYLAPEQAVNSQTVDQRADIYSLGCTLYFLLTGHPPFALGTSQERMAAHRREVPPSLLLDRPDAPDALVAICRRMMEKEPQARYQSADEVQQALSQWLAGQHSPVDAAALVLSARNAAGPRVPGKSKANLVSGSASDLQQDTSESAPFSSAYQDTDCNLNRATVKMPSDLSSSSRADTAAGQPKPSAEHRGESRSVEAFPPPVPPPIVSPPRQRLGDDSSSAVVQVSEFEIPFSPPLVDSAPRPLQSIGARWRRRVQLRSRKSEWTWWLVLAGLFFFALGIAIAALVR